MKRLLCLETVGGCRRWRELHWPHDWQAGVHKCVRNECPHCQRVAVTLAGCVAAHARLRLVPQGSARSVVGTGGTRMRACETSAK